MSPQANTGLQIVLLVVCVQSVGLIQLLGYISVLSPGHYLVPVE